MSSDLQVHLKAHACNPRAGKVKARGFLLPGGLLLEPIWLNLGTPEKVKDPSSMKPKIDFGPPHAHRPPHIYKHMDIHTYKYSHTNLKS